MTKEMQKVFDIINEVEDVDCWGFDELLDVIVINESVEVQNLYNYLVENCKRFKTNTGWYNKYTRFYMDGFVVTWTPLD